MRNVALALLVLWLCSCKSTENAVLEQQGRMYAAYAECVHGGNPKLEAVFNAEQRCGPPPPISVTIKREPFSFSLPPFLFF